MGGLWEEQVAASLRVRDWIDLDGVYIVLYLAFQIIILIFLIFNRMIACSWTGLEKELRLMEYNCMIHLLSSTEKGLDYKS